MTIATRDLSKKMFHEAWPEFQDRDFHSGFIADRLHLLKHNGKNWELYREFLFGRA
jgi:2'-5' RNA ligase